VSRLLTLVLMADMVAQTLADGTTQRRGVSPGRPGPSRSQSGLTAQLRHRLMGIVAPRERLLFAKNRRVSSERVLSRRLLRPAPDPREGLDPRLHRDWFERLSD
jgi:hypothetical protein